MSEILFQYEKINPATWVYLSSLLMIGLFFQFNRFWSVRNLDLVLLILLAPGLLLVNHARERAEKGMLSASSNGASSNSTGANGTGANGTGANGTAAAAPITA